MRSLILVVCVAILSVVPGATLAQETGSLCAVTQDELDAIQSETTPPATTASLDGRLGGSLESFMSLYGEDDMFSQEGCFLFSTISSQPAPDGSDDIVTVIDLWAARDADIEAGTLEIPSDANWTLEEAAAIAVDLLPADIMLLAPEGTEAGNVISYGFSESLAGVTTEEQYTYHEAIGTPGDVEVLFGLSSDGTVWNIAVQLGGIN